MDKAFLDTEFSRTISLKITGDMLPMDAPNVLKHENVLACKS